MPFLIIQGIETYRFCVWSRHCENAIAVAKYLQQHPKVEWVNYAGLEKGTNISIWAQKIFKWETFLYPDLWH